MTRANVTVIGGGLAGSECACQLADRGVSVCLFEMRPEVSSPAHHTGHLAELVCSNSLKSTRPDSAAGLLKRELSLMGSILLKAAFQTQVPAGGALAVDREAFAHAVELEIQKRPNIQVIREEVTEIPQGSVVIAAGPLCSPALAAQIEDLVGQDSLSFFDAAAPIVDAASLNYEILFRQSRYEEQAQGDYLNAPLSREEYEAFISELIGAKRVIPKDFESRDLFQACQPAEEIARKGIDAIRFGAMKPVGLTDPRCGRRPWAAVQLRAENAQLSAYNLVGFQTNLTFAEQRRVFRMIPGLEEAEFFRYGVMHRNTFIDSPHLLDTSFALPKTTIRFAGQITGTEGYVEAIASGLIAGLNTYADLFDRPRLELPDTGAFGSLAAYATSSEVANYQPMHVNFGIVPPLAGERPRNKKERYAAFAERAISDLSSYIAERSDIWLRGAKDESQSFC
ncbi:methylenetetrahydrofolate--tRNA-(uracil(54)-C(5))-methyltransferase (FADH(2)-oxidizing) TrmFO [Collinsella sp. AGMB00827]|uniref:Methylenetetrahydrofolate--tRNA-(uracil-5-)-methyltransferase TrmFO n=1 Tax=Collinsella ureilytica TaxID=2869515 RepID=A0ABS7MKZ2_9ACTN|nr:methylenetetrahydrofolate--tRNA-(uracil(54)-C(5))-methyltransferase (FADH(2)-oxidizing) TrmFO [Collinsella urealyticum]MBY4798041.1 methylenetetrahydrofolate--tRNA-(uracil(54)-C(5))-methyltransferase (FADH(2)-oxidizing) TrmFO [Collinsella urealyticum]